MKTEEKQLYWLNTTLSLFHSIISGFLAVYCVAAYLPGSLYITDDELDTNGLGCITVAVSAGYFFHEAFLLFLAPLLTPYFSTSTNHVMYSDPTLP